MTALVVRETLEPGIERLTFNRPDKMNALSTPLVREFERHLDAIAADRSIRAVILTGAGERSFVAGADIGEYQGRKTAAFIAYQQESRRIFSKLENLPQATIAAIRGYALGGGFEIALCCDILICAESGRMGLPEGLLGLSPGGGGTQRLTRAVGKYLASDIMLAGRRISGARAFQVGLAAECVDDAAHMETAIARARAVKKLAPRAVAEMKALIRGALDTALEPGLTAEQGTLFALYETDDAQEGIDSFLQKREPHFEGK